MSEAVSEKTFKRVAAVSDFKDGIGKRVVVDGKPVAIFRVDGSFQAVTAVCPHAGGPIDEGDVEDGVVTCPWHGMQYHLDTGECLDDPGFKLAHYTVKVEGDDVLVAL